MSAIINHRESRLRQSSSEQAGSQTFERFEQDSGPDLPVGQEWTVLLEPGLQLPVMAPIPVRILQNRIRATLAWIGKDGFGVRVTQDAASQLLAGVWFRCEFRDSENPLPVRLAARVTHGRPTLDGSYYVGLAFLCPNGLEGSSAPWMPGEMRVAPLSRGSQKKI